MRDELARSHTDALEALSLVNLALITAYRGSALYEGVHQQSAKVNAGLCSNYMSVQKLQLDNEQLRQELGAVRAELASEKARLQEQDMVLAQSTAYADEWAGKYTEAVRKYEDALREPAAEKALRESPEK